jgi:hypothetical protein
MLENPSNQCRRYIGIAELIEEDEQRHFVGQAQALIESYGRWLTPVRRRVPQQSDVRDEFNSLVERLPSS